MQAQIIRLTKEANNQLKHIKKQEKLKNKSNAVALLFGIWLERSNKLSE